MEEYLTVLYAAGHGTELLKARRFTEEEKKKYNERYKEIGFVAISDGIMLDYLGWTDLSDVGIWERIEDGSFSGFGNKAYIITQKEWDNLISLNEKKKEEKLKKTRLDNIKFYTDIINSCEKQSKLYTKKKPGKGKSRIIMQ